MRDPAREAFTKLGDKALIQLEELRIVIWDRNFWIGTITFLAMALVIAIDGWIRRGV